jgi:tricorn protease
MRISFFVVIAFGFALPSCAQDDLGSTQNSLQSSYSLPLEQSYRTTLPSGLLALAAMPSVSIVKTESPKTEDVRPHAGMLRYPDVSATHIVFVYANDLWLVPREGGNAVPLASPPGQEMFPRFSPDGQRIVFTGNYDGNRDIYTVAASGGIPQRITHHSAQEMLSDWSEQNQIVFFTNGFAGLARQTQLFTISPQGGMPKKLPVPYGANGVIDAEGEWLAYTPHTIDFRTWKRYRGGMATDIWLFNLKNYSSKKITDWEGTDTYPMWNGKTLYYLSDAGPNHRLNIWFYNPETEEHKQITHFKEYDVKFPSIGPGGNGEGEIVFQNGSTLYLLNLLTHLAKAVQVTIPGARPKIRPQRVDASKNLNNWTLSSTGKRVLIEARGDLWTLPAKEGSVRNLTRSNGSAEREPAWSPDGRWIAYFSDATGEYELYIRQSDGNGEPQQLTSGKKAFLSNPVWSPDSKKIAYTDKTGSFSVLTVATKESKFIDKDTYPLGSVNFQAAWSHDSNWIAYTKSNDVDRSSIWLYNLEKEETHQVTSTMFMDSNPAFDRKGDFLFFASNRQFGDPIYDDYGWGLGRPFVYKDTQVLLAAPLRNDVKDPYVYESDEEEWKEEKKEAEDKKDDQKEEKKSDNDKKEEPQKVSIADQKDEKKDEKESTEEKDTAEVKETKDEEKADEKKEEIKPLEIDLEGFEKRAFLLPIPNGSFGNLSVNHEGKLLYVRYPSAHSKEKSEIKIFDLKDEKKEEKTVLSDQGGYRISSDGKKILVREGNSFAVVDAAAGQSIKDRVSASNLMIELNPREEWRQIFHEAWRMQRDFFYDPNMHGVDWQKIHDHYALMLDDCASREDVGFVIAEMISELNVGHAYYGGGDFEAEPSMSVGMLGVDFELHEGAYRIAKIHQGAVWDADVRSPFNRIPKDQLDEGDYIHAVNRAPIDTSKDPWAAFLGLAGQTVTLTVSDKPKLDEDARDVVIHLMGGEQNLRFRAWIEKNRAYVDKKSGGKVGYIYVTNTSENGQSDLLRQFHGQRDKQALIIDERWNGGGQAPTRFIEVLNRPITNYWAIRDGESIPWPTAAHFGPKCMLINGLAGSGGDMFPALFRQAKLGKLIGMRTWGGLVGMSGNPGLIDGGYVSVPTFAYYDLDGTWGIEGHGVDPDIEVIDDPSLMANGGDPQLDAAIEHMIEMIKTNPYTPPARPKYPDRSGMGILEEDK